MKTKLLIIPILVCIIGILWYSPKETPALTVDSPTEPIDTEEFGKKPTRLPPRALKGYVRASVLSGQIPQFSLTDVTIQEITEAYIEVYEDLGGGHTEEKNLWVAIRSKARKQGLIR